MPLNASPVVRNPTPTLWNLSLCPPTALHLNQIWRRSNTAEEHDCVARDECGPNLLVEFQYSSTLDMEHPKLVLFVAGLVVDVLDLQSPRRGVQHPAYYPVFGVEELPFGYLRCRRRGLSLHKKTWASP
ncbi:hypothetical protein N8I77_000570 [Diaporthe amygdali]|uniref:Uncharacterized protein n=1 Tax=Phomopsis amygdali TaxID=1214568 RepID=A0AAD9SPV3_PHOAM|nr:hypothetical protein N8I77_000570 [Diaporthe amygdali]KAK2613677.1 hypothetical protein N8I77_000570 [Diaporthe amygdali]